MVKKKKKIPNSKQFPDLSWNDETSQAILHAPSTWFSHMTGTVTSSTIISVGQEEKQTPTFHFKLFLVGYMNHLCQHNPEDIESL